MAKFNIRELLDENTFNWLGIIFVSLFANLFILFFTNDSFILFSDWCLLISSLFFLFSGIKYLKSSADYKDAYQFWESNKNQYRESGRSKVIAQQIRTKIKNPILLSVFPFLAFITLICIPFLPSDEITNAISEPQGLYTKPHSRLTLATFDKFAEDQKIYETQVRFINDVVKSKGIDSTLIVDALSCYGKTAVGILDSLKTKSLILEGCYETTESRTKSIINGLSDNSLRKCHWAELYRIYEANSVGLIYLFNNSLAELNGTYKVDSVLRSYYNILKPDGYLTFDFENLEIARRNIAPQSGKGIRRITQDIPNEKDYYNVIFKYIDINKEPIVDSILYKRKHSKALCDSKRHIEILKKIGFSEIQTIRYDDRYPFEFIVAKK